MFAQRSAYSVSVEMSEDGEESKCPVSYPGKGKAIKAAGASSSSEGASSSPLTAALAPVIGAAKSPSSSTSSTTSSSLSSAPPLSADDKCPVMHSASESGTAPTGYGVNINDMVFGQDRQRDQKRDLSTKRVISTIPKNEFTPDHQPKGEEKWMYPSEQQYFNAIRRKGYQASEDDIPVIVAIHNTVNEQGWTMIREWELLRGNTNPKLTRFMGRPQDVSPKAYLLNFFFGYKLPFDRHDWIIDRNGKQIRYVIDFYTGSKSEAASRGMPVSLHLDVRPALDIRTSLFGIPLILPSGTAIVDRFMHYFYGNFMPWKVPLPQKSGSPTSNRNSSDSSTSSSSR